MVVLRVGNLKLPSVIHQVVVLALHLEDYEPEGTSCRACGRASDCRLGFVVLGLVTFIIVTCLDCGLDRSRTILVEAVAVLHPMASQRVESPS